MTGMEVFLLGSAASTTAAGAAVAATPGLIGFGGSVTAMGLMSAGSTIFSGLSAIQGGRQQQATAKSQARFEKFNAKQEYIRGVQEEAATLRGMAQRIALAKATSASKGVDITGGSPALSAKEAQKDADKTVMNIRDNTQNAMMSREMTAQTLRRRGDIAAMEGYGSAAGVLFDYADKQYSRGVLV